MEITREHQSDAEITDITCDICGQSTRVGFTNEFNYIHFWTIWGKASTHNLEYHALDLCNRCYDELPEYIRNAVRVRDIMTGENRVGVKPKESANA